MHLFVSGVARALHTVAAGDHEPATLRARLVLATFVIAANIIVDVLYAVIDPRVKVS